MAQSSTLNISKKTTKKCGPKFVEKDINNSEEQSTEKIDKKSTINSNKKSKKKATKKSAELNNLQNFNKIYMESLQTNMQTTVENMKQIKASPLMKKIATSLQSNSDLVNELSQNFISSSMKMQSELLKDFMKQFVDLANNCKTTDEYQAMFGALVTKTAAKGLKNMRINSDAFNSMNNEIQKNFAANQSELKKRNTGMN